MKRKIAILFFVLIAVLQSNTNSYAQTYPGTNLRGRIITTYYNQVTPLVSAKVDLFYFDKRYPAGQQWRLIASTVSDAYGFYFFRGIIPNNYTIWVNQAKSYNIKVVAINYRLYTFQDIPQFSY